MIQYFELRQAIILVEHNAWANYASAKAARFPANSLLEETAICHHTGWVC
jgi:hypothetical protein